MMKNFFWIALWLPALLFAVDDNTIVIRGHKRESYQPKRSGKSLIIRPEAPSRFETKTHLKEESALLVPETGTVSASGFAVPKIRGQETKMTELYLEDIQLQDPFTGLPIVDDIDIRAFGEIDVYQGFSPPKLHSVNPIGTIQYRSRPIFKLQSQAGISYGRPFGNLVWGKIQDLGTIGESDYDYKLYLRHHDTDGRYSYYSDNDTPYNENDDFIAIRDNNHRRGGQVLATSNYYHGSHKTSLLLWGNSTKRGVPDLSASIKSWARESKDNRLASLSYSYKTEPFNPLWPDELQLYGNYNRDVQKMYDPTQAYLWLKTSSKIHTTSSRLRCRASWRKESHDIHTGFEWSKADVKTWSDDDMNVDLQRKIYLGYLTTKIDMSESILFEGKVSKKKHQDSFAKLAAAGFISKLAAKNRSIWVEGTTLGLAWHSQDLPTIYAQYGDIKRPPSLMEEFGNGATVLGNPEIGPEATRHGELGILFQNSKKGYRLSFVSFRDQGSDKIVFTRAMKNTIRAKNVDKTIVTGFDFQGAKEFASSGVKLGITRLYPYDVTSQAVRLLLPGIPEWQGVLGVWHCFHSVTARITSRYRSQVYRDSNESVIVPAHLIHDFSLDTHHAFADKELKTGLKIDNFTDVKKLPIYSPGSDYNKGYTSYSTSHGHPLPGRHWKVFVEIAFN